MSRKTPVDGASFGRIALVFLAGLLLGGLYVGLVAPVRTVIQADFGLDDAAGIWVINIYTLFYAAVIPISGKLADQLGARRVFAACSLLFAAGAALCGLSQAAGGMALLLAGRVVQAVGAGGIIPVATAQMGVLAPEGKRGMWLGIAAATSGLSNVLGAAAGSAIVGVVGVHGWPWAFFISVPIGVLLACAALAWLPRANAGVRAVLDVAGSVAFLCFVLALLAGLNSLSSAVTSSQGARGALFVAGCAIAAIAAALVFARIERRAAEPIFHMEYLHDGRILLVMAASFFVGCTIISMVLVPEFAEFALGLPVGTGGLYMAVIGVFAIVGPPMGGKLIDKHGAKPVFAAGSAVVVAGFAFLALVAAPHPSAFALVAGLSLVGLGLGFTMGTPLNYLILQLTGPRDSNAAIATIALVRQMGTTLAPAVMVALIGLPPSMAGYAAMLLFVAAASAAAAVLVSCVRLK